ncbi:hypothetical protein DQ04_00741110 [Trypanosoma grayi]|uniref:hypothetical protein n=1 Tax=Trypanosoma grayi TaxID=71804 RepID=UPI0004F41FD9|nr:hypothetical protein DQ04_00741110 [Trypanosoma grayi]KEG13867.1 hypothetical protein DQ04_00741110 [Trypanosoma grayi]
MQLGAATALSREALRDTMQRLFPPARTHGNSRAAASPRMAAKWVGENSPHAISDGWPHALLLVELSRMCVSPTMRAAEEHTTVASQSFSSSSMTSTGSSTILEKETIVYLLNHCRFPVDCWWVSLRLLGRWRQLNREQDPARTSEVGPNVFPPGISIASTAHLMRNLSYCNAAWADVLRLYVTATCDATTVTETRDAPSNSEQANRREVASRGALRWMRHIALTSLLRAGQWRESLHFYRHMLYQRETPSHVCTGHLVQRLGEVGCWTAVACVFQLNLRLLEASHTRDISGAGKNKSTVSSSSSSQHALLPTAAQTKSDDWGTMFSMALDAVSRHCQQPRVALQMFDEACKRNADGSLFSWDGNFLSAVQALPSERDRLAVLRRAKAAGQLNYFKLVRGLVHHEKWLEAIAVFAEGLATQQLGRKEIGRCRLGILHASSGDNVQAVVCRLQSLCGRPRDSLHLNDAEVECVLSKVPSASLSAAAAAPHSAAHWRFCLQILSENYASLSHNEGSGVSHKRYERCPTTRMLSLLLRNPIPWHGALRLLAVSRTLDRYEDGSDTAAECPTLSKALMLNHVVEILHAQGQQQRAADVVTTALRQQKLSPSAKMLEFVPLELLSPSTVGKDRNVLMVSDKVLFYFVQTTENWQRALSIVRLVECQRATMGIGAVDPLRALPASVHCGALRMIQRCAARSEAWAISLLYFQHVVSGYHLLDGPPQSGLNPQQQQHDRNMDGVVYSIMYEMLLNLLSGPPGISGLLRGKAHLRLVESVVARSGGRVPTHMLLPNQMDRLLPRFSSASANLPNMEERTRVSIKLVRCIIASLSAPSGGKADAGTSLTPPEAVMFHELQKLTCRVAEYRRHIQQLREENDFSSGCGIVDATGIRRKGAQPRALDAGLLWQTSLELLELQCRFCGTRTISHGTLKLVYHTCAMSGGQWRAALLATEYLLQRKKVEERAVSADHCSLYCSLFGWEKALAVWCRHFPQRMLSEVSGCPAGVEYCLNSREL